MTSHPRPHRPPRLPTDPRHPLLLRLRREAPGTCRHCLLVARLAHAAARRIGADRALARAGGLFHDIGKLHCPRSFAENQPGTPTASTSSAPRDQARTIRDHVRRGVRVAAESGLPRTLADIIQQHHGTAPVPALTPPPRRPSARAGPTRTLRYPGPKPNTAEAALVLLADAAEAAARTLPLPTPQRLRALVRRCLARPARQGQLDHSPLTPAQLLDVEDAFVAVLARVFRPGSAPHPRRRPAPKSRPPTSTRVVRR